PGSRQPWASTTSYLMYSVLFRAAIQFAMVWLVAAVHQLAASRTVLTADAVLEERARLQREVRASLERHLAALRDASRRARAARGDAPSYGVARVAIAAALAFGLIWALGSPWETSAWFVPITAVPCLRGRARIAVVALAGLSMLTYDTLTWLGTDDPSAYALC